MLKTLKTDLNVTEALKSALKETQEFETELFSKTGEKISPNPIRIFIEFDRQMGYTFSEKYTSDGLWLDPHKPFYLLSDEIEERQGLTYAFFLECRESLRSETEIYVSDTERGVVLDIIKLDEEHVATVLLTDGNIIYIKFNLEEA